MTSDQLFGKLRLSLTAAAYRQQEVAWSAPIILPDALALKNPDFQALFPRRPSCRASLNLGDGILACILDQLRLSDGSGLSAPVVIAPCQRKKRTGFSTHNVSFSLGQVVQHRVSHGPGPARSFAAALNAACPPPMLQDRRTVEQIKHPRRLLIIARIFPFEPPAL
jgi:hypothetical protein